MQPDSGAYAHGSYHVILVWVSMLLVLAIIDIVMVISRFTLPYLLLSILGRLRAGLH